MKKGDYIKHYTKRKRNNPSDVFMKKVGATDADGDQLYGMFDKSNVETAKENGWVVVSKAMNVPTEAQKVEPSQVELSEEDAAELKEFKAWKAQQAKKKAAAEKAKKTAEAKKKAAAEKAAAKTN